MLRMEPDQTCPAVRVWQVLVPPLPAPCSAHCSGLQNPLVSSPGCSSALVASSFCCSQPGWAVVARAHTDRTQWTRLRMRRLSNLLCKLVPSFHKNAKKVPQSATACDSLPTTHLPSAAGKYGSPKNRYEESQRKHMADGTRSLTIRFSVSALTV